MCVFYRPKVPYSPQYSYQKNKVGLTGITVCAITDFLYKCLRKSRKLPNFMSLGLTKNVSLIYYKYIRLHGH